MLSHFMDKTSAIKNVSKKYIKQHYHGEIITATDLQKVSLR